MAGRPRHPKYQDYVIRDGELVGDFEGLYQDHDDPWRQSEESCSTDKAIAINWLKTIGAKRVLELGCGLGLFSEHIRRNGFEVLGVDISPTAVRKARGNSPQCRFVVGDVLDRQIYRDFQPDAVIMASVTWYVLDKLDDFLRFMRQEFPRTHIIHLLATYPPGVQKYGRDKFTSLREILAYFDMRYLEWGEIRQRGCDTAKTFFLGRWP